MAKEHMDIHNKLLKLALRNVTLLEEEREMLRTAANMIVDLAVNTALIEKMNDYQCHCEPGQKHFCICYTKK